MKRVIAVILIFCFLLAGCARQDGEETAAPGTTTLGGALSAESVSLQKPDPAFIQGQMNFALRLFQQAAEKNQGENVLLSPLSVASALAMTANGAAGKTAEEMLTVLGSASIDTLNSQMGDFLKNLPSDKTELKVANSIWFGSGLGVKESFLQSNVNYYNAEVFESAFNAKTVQDINAWVQKKTDGMIEELVDELDATAVMHLINAVAFDGEWEEAYAENKIRNGTFYALDGTKQNARMMGSAEDYWLESKNACGFLKDYAGGEYRFAALLPDRGVDIYDYVQGLTAQDLHTTLQNAEKTEVTAVMPKFRCEFDIELSDALSAMGMPSAFGAADFSNMANTPLAIDRVQHKTFIEVCESGTRAAAATDVTLKYSSDIEVKTVTLEHPFVYFILDAETNLPIFMGIVTAI